MSAKRLLYLTLIFSLLFFGLCFAETDEKCFQINKKLGRGINLGNALDAPEEGSWGVTLQSDYFKLIKQAGFDSVRIPIRFSAHAEKESPYTISPVFFDRIDWALQNCADSDLLAIINVHHYEGICEHPSEHADRLVALWKQIAARYEDMPDTVVFELLNEPNDKLTDEPWNKLLVRVLSEVRKSNHDRIVLIGPASWNSPEHLDKLSLPEGDRNIIVTFHYYQPFHFTHQGAPWLGEQSEEWLGQTWQAADKQRDVVLSDFKQISDWATQNDRPVNLGEFGVFEKADMDSRRIWTNFVARTAERNNFSWHYWEFCSGFGAYDAKEKTWRKPLLDALVPSPQKPVTVPIESVPVPK